MEAHLCLQLRQIHYFLFLGNHSHSQDGTVKIWKLKLEKNYSMELKESNDFNGAVYGANFNFLGDMIAISYCNEGEERVETVIMREKRVLMGERVTLD